jgi:hypothetical protein
LHAQGKLHQLVVKSNPAFGGAFSIGFFTCTNSKFNQHEINPR